MPKKDRRKSLQRRPVENFCKKSAGELLNTKTFNDFLAGQDCISNICQNFPVSGRFQQMDINHSAFSGSGYAPILTKDFNNDFAILRIKADF